MAVKLGTVAPVGFDDFASPQWIECMKKLGCTTVQVYRNRHGNDSKHSGPVTPDQIREYLDMAELPCDSIHGVYGNDVDVSSTDEPTRKTAVRTFMDEGKLAIQLGGPLVVVHCSGIYPGGLDDKALRSRRASLKKSIRELAVFGHAEGVKFAFENLPEYHAIGSRIEDLCELLDEVNSDAAGMCFDTGHAHLCGDVCSAISAARRLMYIHVSDNNARKDEHLMPGRGSIDWNALSEVLAAKQYDGVFMLETFHSVDELKILINAGWPEKLAKIIQTISGR